VHGLPGGETAAGSVDLDLEVALDDMDRPGLVAVQVGRQRPAGREAIYGCLTTVAV
jgi:hypothetical protein